VSDPKVVDILLHKGRVEYQETVNFWKQEPHVLGPLLNGNRERPHRTFMQKFFEGGGDQCQLAVGVSLNFCRVQGGMKMLSFPRHPMCNIFCVCIDNFLSFRLQGGFRCESTTYVSVNSGMQQERRRRVIRRLSGAEPVSVARLYFLSQDETFAAPVIALGVDERHVAFSQTRCTTELSLFLFPVVFPRADFPSFAAVYPSILCPRGSMLLVLFVFLWMRHSVQLMPDHTVLRRYVVHFIT